MDTLTIGVLARTAKVNVDTVRFYEREGLLSPTARNGRGWRRYGDEALHTLRFIKGAQKAGFTLAEIRTLLEKRGDEEGLCVVSHRAAEKKLKEVEQRIGELDSIRSFLRRELDACRPGPDQGSCTVAKYLKGDSK